MTCDETLTYIFFTVFAGLAIWLLWSRRDPPNYPPGPKGLPFIGVLPFMSKYPQRSYAKWSQEKYGPIMSIRLLGHNQVVLNNYDTMKQAFEVEGDYTSGRFKSFLFSKLQGNNGIAFVDGTDYYLDQKEFGVNWLKAYGGVDGFEKVINNGIDCLLNDLESKVGKPVEIKRQLFDLVANIVMKIFFEIDLKHEDLTSQILFETFENILGNEDDSRLLFAVELLPILRFFPPMYQALQRLVNRANPSMEWIRSYIQEAKKDLDKKNTASFVHHYLREQKADTNPSKQEDQLVAYVRDCVGGIRNAYSTLRWIILCALLHPEYHKQVVEEVDKVLGKNDVPASEKANLPFTCAFIEETLRLCSPLPKSLERKTHAKIRLGKYVIPKGTELAGNFWGANHDPIDWPDPNKFDPFRHIDESGKLISPTKVIQFSLGPRKCFGQYFARPLLFMTLARLLQRYEISAVPEKKLPDLYDGYQGITYDAKAYDVIFKDRF